MPLEPNKYFYGMPVNSNFSVVHVPTNVFDGGSNLITYILVSGFKILVMVTNHPPN
jgi:hypothetical protein